MQSYNKIFNPYTNSFVKTNSTVGRYLINNMVGGAALELSDEEELAQLRAQMAAEQRQNENDLLFLRTTAIKRFEYINERIKFLEAIIDKVRAASDKHINFIKIRTDASKKSVEQVRESMNALLRMDTALENAESSLTIAASQ